MRQFITAILIQASVIFLLIGYFWVHKPFDLQFLQSLGGLSLDSFTLFLLVTLSGGIGTRLLRLMKFDFDSRVEQFAMASLLGLGLQSLLGVIFGLLGLFNTIFLWGGLVIGGLIAYRDVQVWLRDFRTILHIATHPPTAWTRLLAVFVWFAVISAGLFAFAPPDSWDGLAYHLVGIERYLDAGRIEVQPDNFYLGLSQNGEMLYSTTVSLFGRNTVIAPVHLWVGLMGFLSLAGFVRRHTDLATGWLTLVIPLTSFSIWVIMGYSYVDLIVLAYGAVVLIAILYWRKARHDRWLFLAGIGIGLAMGVKYPSGLLLVSAVGVILLNKPTLLGLIRSGVIMGGVAFVVFLPWMAKGTLLYENPVYPFVLDGVNWDDTRATFFNDPDSGLISQGELWQIPLIPIAATIFGVERGGGYAFTTGVWLLTAPFLLIFVWHVLPSRNLARDAFIFALPMLLFWMVMASLFSLNMQTRLMTMLFPPMIMMGALGFYGLTQLPQKPLDIAFIVRAVFAVTLLLNVVDMVFEITESRVVDYHFSPGIDRDDYLLRDPRVGGIFSVYQTFDRLQQDGTVRPDATIRLMWEPKEYYCPASINCIADVLIDHWRYPISQGQSPDAIFQQWYEAGEDNLLVWENGLYFTVQLDLENFPGADLFIPTLEKYMTPIWTDDFEYTLYEWNEDVAFETD